MSLRLRSDEKHNSRVSPKSTQGKQQHDTTNTIIMTRTSTFWLSTAPSLPFKKLWLVMSCVAIVTLWQNLRVSTISYEAVVQEAADDTVTDGKIAASGDVSNQHLNLIVYLSQGPASSYARLSKRFQSFPAARFFYHSYDRDCDGCIFQANTTLPRGRNLVLKTAYNTLTNNNVLDRVKYFIMMDDDVEIQCVSSRKDCWLEYHHLLLDERTTWPLLAPKFYVDGDEEPTMYHTCRDDSLWVMRHDYVHFLYPFPTKHDTKTWNIYVRAVWERMKRCFPNGFLTHQEYRNYNPRHGEYPKGLRKKLVVDLLNDEYPSLGPWTLQPSTGRAFRCTRALQKPPLQQQVDPACAAKTKERFQKWINGS